MIEKEKWTREIDALKRESVHGVLESLSGIHSEVLHVLLNQIVERLLRDRTDGLRWWPHWSALASSARCPLLLSGTSIWNGEAEVFSNWHEWRNEFEGENKFRLFGVNMVYFNSLRMKLATHDKLERENQRAIHAPPFVKSKRKPYVKLRSPNFLVSSLSIVFLNGH